MTERERSLPALLAGFNGRRRSWGWRRVRILKYPCILAEWARAVPGLAGIPLGQLYKRECKVSGAAQVCPPPGRTTVVLGMEERPGAQPPA